MKQKSGFFSSVMVALLAGFIYYQLGGVEDIKKIPGYAYNLFSYIVKLDIPNQVSINADIALKDKNSAPECASESSLEYGDEATETENINLNPSENDMASMKKVSEHFMNVYPFEFNYPQPLKTEVPRTVILPDFELPDVKKITESVRQELKIQLGENQFANLNFDDCEAVSDSNKYKFNFKFGNLDSLNIKLDFAMENLNKALESLNLDSLNERIQVRIPKIEIKEFDIEVPEIPETPKAPEIPDMKDFKENMDKFEEDMKEYKMDMKEFNNEMQKFNEEMQKFGKEMKKLNKEKIKEQINRYKLESSEVDS